MKIVFEETAYDGAESMPAEVRARYEGALALARSAGVELPANESQPGVHVKLNVNVRRRIVYNGVAYDDAAQLPEQVQEALAQQGRRTALAAQRTQARRPSTPAELWALCILMGALLLALVLYLQEYRALEYTFDDNGLFVWGAAFGVLGAAPLLLLLIPRLASLTPFLRLSYGLLLVFALTGAGAPLACKLNRERARTPTETWSFTITGKRHIPRHGRSSEVWEVRADAAGRKLRFTVPPSVWNRLAPGGRYTGEVRRGGLGYPFLTEAGLH